MKNKFIQKVLGFLFAVFLLFGSIFTNDILHAIEESRPHVDLVINTLTPKIFSGETASYLVNFKVSGGIESVNEALANSSSKRLEIQLPVNALEYYELQSTLDELKIVSLDANGNKIETVPTYSRESGKIVYDFATLRTGTSSEFSLKLRTKNGVTPDQVQLPISVKFESDQYRVPKTPDAIATVHSKANLAVTKTALPFKDTEKEYGYAGETAKWKIGVSAPTFEKGSALFAPNTEVVVTDVLDEKLEYVTASGEGVNISRSGQTITMRFNTPSIEEQKTALSSGRSIFEKTVTIETRVKDTVLTATKINNKVSATATDISNKQVSAESGVATVAILEKSPVIHHVEGNYYYLNFWGPNPTNLLSGAPNDNINPSPVVPQGKTFAVVFGSQFVPGRYWDMSIKNYRDGYIKDSDVTANNSSGVAIAYDVKKVIKDGLKYLEYTHKWDEHLAYYRLYIHKPVLQYSSSAPAEDMPLLPHVKLTMTSRDGRVVEKDLGRENYAKYLTVDQLGLTEKDDVASIKLHYYYPDGSPVDGRINARVMHQLRPKNDGHIGKAYAEFVEMKWESPTGDVYTLKPHLAEGENSTVGPRSIQVVSPPKVAPVITNDVYFAHKEGSLVKNGQNRIVYKLTNLKSSPASVLGPIKGHILLPLGVKINETAPNEKYIFLTKTGTSGSYEKVDNFEGTGRQLIKVSFDRDTLLENQSLSFEIDVNIEKSAPKNLNVVGFTTVGNEEIQAGRDESIKIELDGNDIDGNLETLKRLTAVKTYVLEKSARLATIKLVKGSLDSNFTLFGHTELGKDIEYKIKLSNITNESISKLSFIDILPNVGDKTVLTDEVRNSKFTPKLKQALQLVGSWSDKVDVFYSTSNNPKRDDLFNAVNYPAGAYEYQNPAGAEDANWLRADQVTNWSDIRSFKLQLKNEMIIEAGDNLELTFTMVAPTSVDDQLLNSAVAERERAAWNSFAVTTDTLLPTEPERVGVVLVKKQKVKIVKVATNEETRLLENATFKLLDSQSMQVGDLKSTTANGEVEFTDLVVGQSYYIEETAAPTNYKLNSKKYKLVVGLNGVTVENADEKILNVSTGTDKVTTIKVSNDFIDIPPGPTVEKKIYGTLTDLYIPTERNYTYNISTTIPVDITNYERYVLTDVLNDKLQIAPRTTPKIVGDAARFFDVTVDGQTVKATMKDFADAGVLAGQKVELFIVAQIKAGVTEKKIPNTVTLDHSHKPNVYGNLTPPPGKITPPPVTVTPPTEPKVEKKINETLDHAFLGHEQDYTYNIYTVIPNDIVNYRKYELVDTLHDNLKIKEGSTPRINGEAARFFDVEVVGQTVTARMKDFANAEALAGTKVELIIDAQIKAGVAMERIENEVNLNVEHTPDVYGNQTPPPTTITPPPVTVTPPLPPTVEKKINETLTDLYIPTETDYTYNIYTTIPADIINYESYVLTDVLNDNLQIKAGTTPRIVGDAARFFDVTVEGQTVKATMKDFADAGALAGQKVELVIDAQIKAGVTDKKIPNTVTLDHSHKPNVYGNQTPPPGTITPPPVTVTPPNNPKVPPVDTSDNTMEYVYYLLFSVLGFALYFATSKKFKK